MFNPNRTTEERNYVMIATTTGIATKGYAAQSATTPVAPFAFEHREPGENDVLIDIQFCGICHSDIHQARNEWGNALYPMVPGHEIVGTIARVGSKVKKFKVGDLAATVWTYNSKDKQGNLTYGGYANHIVADEAFVLSVPKNLDPAAAAPLLCAGITTYSPLKHWGAGPGKKVGVIGLGGLGHMALKFSHAFGAQTVQFTTSANKIEDAKKLGADDVILTKEANWQNKHLGSFDFILDCVSAPHDVTPYFSLLKRDGTLCTVGIPETPVQIHAFSVAMGRKSFSGSAIGGIKETQEMLDFCGKHNIVSDIEMTSFDKVNEAWDRVVKGDVKYRFVLDLKTL
jgi:alcohol dehydrogenase (NADP+)